MISSQIIAARAAAAAAKTTTARTKATIPTCAKTTSAVTSTSSSSTTTSRIVRRRLWNGHPWIGCVSTTTNTDSSTEHSPLRLESVLQQEQQRQRRRHQQGHLEVLLQQQQRRAFSCGSFHRSVSHWKKVSDDEEGMNPTNKDKDKDKEKENEDNDDDDGDEEDFFALDAKDVMQGDEPITIIGEGQEELSEEEIEQILQEQEDELNNEGKDQLLHDGITSHWKPGERKYKLKKGYDIKEFEYEMFPEKFGWIDEETGLPIKRWTLRDVRCGAIGIKVGMIPIWDDWGERHPCTIVYLDKNLVLGHKTMDKHGYDAIQVAAGERKIKRVSKALLGQYKSIMSDDDDVHDYGNDNNQYETTSKRRINHPPYLVREFRISSPDHFIPIGTQIHARHFVPGQNVDIAGISKGKGFQGAMKRHNFGGMPASHGTSRSHRALGSTGQCQDPGKVFKGKKMAGRMGGDRVTVQNLRIVKIDRGNNILYIKGAIPGNKGGFVEIRDAIKKPLWGTKHVLDEIKQPPVPTFPFDEQIDGVSDTIGIYTREENYGKYEEMMPQLEEDPLDPDYNDSVTAFNFKE